MVTDEAVVEETTPAVETSPEVVESTTPETSQTEESEAPAVAEPPAYQPDFKLKVWNQDAELEDKFLKDLMKDPDSEKKVKEIAQKSMGFDIMKPKYEEQKQSFQQYHQSVQPVVDVYNQFNKLYQTKDYDNMFKLLNIPDEDIFRYAVRKAEEANLPAEQKQAIQYQRQIAQQKNYLEEQNQHLQQTQSQQLSDFRAQELKWVMAKPEVSGVQQAFDAKNGPGAFQNLVRDKGLAHYAQTQGREDLTAEQAVTEVLKLIGGFVNPTSPGATTQGAPANQALIPQNGAPPIIPNVTGRGTSPVKKQVRSIDDLKKKAAEMGRSSSSQF